jgi:hypothetical protein
LFLSNENSNDVEVWRERYILEILIIGPIDVKLQR